METVKNGLLVEKFPKILVDSQSAIKTSKLKTLKVRAKFSNHTCQLKKINVTRIRITFSIFKFLIKIGLMKKSEIKFRMFSDIFEGFNDVKNLCWSEDEDISWTLQYWHRKGGREVSKSIKMGFVEKSAVTEDGILFGNFRTKDGQKFFTTEECKEDNFDSEVKLNLIKMPSCWIDTA